MRRIIITGLIVILNLALQTTVLQAFEIRNIVPNMAVVMVVSFSLLRGSLSGGAVGFFCGLLQDILFGMSIGYYSLLYMLMGYICGRLNENYYRENYFLPILISAICEFIFESLIYFSYGFMSGNLKYISYLFSLIIPAIVYTTIFVIPIYRFIFGVNEYLERLEKRNRSLFR